MAVNRRMISGITTIGSHAPLVNLVMDTISSTTPVAVAPRALMVMPLRQPGSFRLRWRFTIPDWLIVKEVNTPTA